MSRGDESLRRLDLPARNARYARLLAGIAFFSILLSVGLFGLVFLTSPALLIWAAAAAALSLLFGVAALVFRHRCLRPRPVGAPFVLIASIFLCLAYGWMFAVLRSVVTMRN